MPYHFIVLAIVLPLLFIFCYPVGLRADTPTVSTHFFINLLLGVSLAHFSHLYLFWVLLVNIPAVPAHFITSSIGLPRPIYFSFTSFIPMSFLLNLLDFLNPITTSLPLVTFRAYWPPSQPIKFINSFPKLPRPIYFLFTSYYSYGLATSFLELPRSIYFFFTSFYSCGPADYQSCHSSLLGLFSYFFTVFFFSPSPLLGFFYC